MLAIFLNFVLSFNYQTYIDLYQWVEDVKHPLRNQRMLLSSLKAIRKLSLLLKNSRGLDLQEKLRQKNKKLPLKF